MKEIDCAWVFAGGDFSCAHFPLSEVADHHRLVCVDRGVEHCLALGLTPTLLVGDFDSACEDVLRDKRLLDVPKLVYSSDKAASDLELALDILCDDAPETVVILGVSGGRTDHMLFNWMLPVLKTWPFSIQLIDATMWCHVLNGPECWEATESPESLSDDVLNFSGFDDAQAIMPKEESTTRLGISSSESRLERVYPFRSGQTISLIALRRVSGVFTKGLQYALNDAVIHPGSTLGLSNVVVQNKAVVCIEQGTLLVMLHRA